MFSLETSISGFQNHWWGEKTPMFKLEKGIKKRVDILFKYITN